MIFNLRVKKWIICLLLLMFAIIKIYNNIKDTEQEKDLQMNFNYVGHHFPSCDSLMPNSLICFFAKATCPSCIYDIMNYYDILARSNKFPMSFITVDGNTQLNELRKRIPTLITLDVDSLYLSLRKPLLIITNENGTITDYEIVNFETPYLTRDFMYRYSLVSN